jgi:hypothetical protein
MPYTRGKRCGLHPVALLGLAGRHPEVIHGRAVAMFGEVPSVGAAEGSVANNSPSHQLSLEARKSVYPAASGEIYPRTVVVARRSNVECVSPHSERPSDIPPLWRDDRGPP